MRDPCDAGLWDIRPDERCPICGALPDTRCDGTIRRRILRLFGDMTTTTQPQEIAA